MIKFTAIIFCMLVGFYVEVKGDTITLSNVSKDIELKVISVTNEYITALIPRKSIKSLNMQFLKTGNYPDIIDFEGAAVGCKIKEITEDTIQVLIPTTTISKLQMSFPSDNKLDKQVKTVPVGIEDGSKKLDVGVEEEKMEKMEDVGEVEEVEEKTTESKIPDTFAEKEIVDEIRTGYAGKTGGGKNYRLKTKRVKRESTSEEGDLSKAKTENEPLVINEEESVLEEKPQESEEASEPNQQLSIDSPDKDFGKAVTAESKKEEPVIQDPNLGRVEGKIFNSGKPLPECQVKLQMLEKSGLLAKGYRPVEGALELETTTSEDGIYQFMNVSPGQYKLHWKPPSETTWIRRFKMEPDVIVEAGKLTKPKEIETMKRTLN